MAQKDNNLPLKILKKSLKPELSDSPGHTEKGCGSFGTCTITCPFMKPGRMSLSGLAEQQQHHGERLDIQKAITFSAHASTQQAVQLLKTTD